MRIVPTILFFVFLIPISFGFAGYDHNHDEGEKDHASAKTEGHDDHKNDHKDEHEEEAASANVGPDKGLTSFDEHSGFTLSKEATKNFEIQTARLGNASPWTLPRAALVVTGEDKSVFRVRKERFLRVDVEILKKSKSQVTLRAKDLAPKGLAPGDEVVVSGAGFLRVAEIDATSGESGHHH